MSARVRHGFTLVEVVVVIAIAGILALLTLSAVRNMRSGSTFASSTNEMVAALRRTKAEALARGLSTAFVIDQTSRRWWSMEMPPGMTLATFASTFNMAANPATPGSEIARGSLPRGVTFGPATGWGSSFAAPFAGIPTTTGAGAALNFCSFCTAGGVGVIRFEPGGQVTYNNAGTQLGQQFTVTGNVQAGSRVMAVAVVTRNGLIEVFER